MGVISDINVFLGNPLNVYICIASVSISLLLFLLLKFNRNSSNRQKLFMTYGHVFTLVFPVVYFVYSAGCKLLFARCDRTSTLIYLGVLALISAGITAMLIGPFFFFNRFRKLSKKLKRNYITGFVAAQAKLMKLKKIDVYLLNTAKPKAFSFSYFAKGIFVSVGLVDLLSKKELEAVLLHELAHIRDNSPSLKISHFVLQVFSPFSKFASFVSEIDIEEQKADAYAIAVQGTSRYLLSAKKIMDEFYSFA